MAGATAHRRKAEGMLEFVERRAREQFDRAREGVREAAHDAYGRATRVGETLDLPTTGEVLTFGTGLLSDHHADAKSSTARSTTPSPQASGERRVHGAAPPVKGAPGQENLAGSDWLAELNRNPYAKAAAGYAGMLAGWIPGAARGVEHIEEGVLDAAMFASRALHPELDYAINPPGRRAPDQVLQAGKAVIDYAARVARDPDKPMRDARQFAHQVNVDLNPLATPSSDTATGEFKRLYDIGQNQGELALNVGASVVGAEGLQALGAAGRTARATRYLSDAGYGRAANYLRKPYKGMGNHSFLPRRLNAPDWLSDNSFMRQTFRHESQGGAYVKHVEADPRAYGFRLPSGMGARGWSGKKAGVRKLHGLARLWASTPENTKTLLGGVAGAGGGVIHEPIGEDRSW